MNQDDQLPICDVIDIEAYEETIEEKNSIKFFEGIASSFELRQAQLQLLDSQQKYLNSVLQLISIKTELETLYNNTN